MDNMDPPLAMHTQLGIARVRETSEVGGHPMNTAQLQEKTPSTKTRLKISRAKMTMRLDELEEVSKENAPEEPIHKESKPIMKANPNVGPSAPAKDKGKGKVGEPKIKTAPVALGNNVNTANQPLWRKKATDAPGLGCSSDLRGRVLQDDGPGALV
uniref:Uncharacterized protein n=1 Tax=Cannabis sativa TaxID=3483 RepID=A0A803NLG2_CANSA